MIDVHLNTIVVRDGLRPSCIVERSEGFTYGWWEQQRETKHLQSRNQQLTRFIFDWCSFRSRLLPQGQQACSGNKNTARKSYQRQMITLCS